MKIGIIGHTSKIGKALIQRGCAPLDCNVLKPNSIERVLARRKPDIIVNLASCSDPDWCQIKENFDEVLAVNVRGLYNVATLAEKLNIPVVTLSTDHIWNGKTGWDKNVRAFTRKGPYKEDYPRFAPVNVYGLSKVGMEVLTVSFDNVKIVRTSYCFDTERLKWDIDGFKKGYPAQFPTFIERSFIHTKHFVDSFMEYLQKFYEMPQTLHISGSSTVSWFEFMKSLVEIFGFDLNLIFPRKKELNFVPRPHKCGLNVSLSAKLGLPQFDYMDGLKYMKENE